jgi:hypothetical protein
MIFSHPDPFVIHVNTQFHPPWPHRPDRPKPAPPLPIEQRFYRNENPLFVEAERKLQEWIRSILDTAANEHRISQIANFVTQRWEHDPECTESDGGYDPDLDFPWEDDHEIGFREDEDAIDSWDEESSRESAIEFCGYKVDGDLVESVWELVDKALEEHESAIRFYGLDSRAPNAALCHCRVLRGVAIPLVDTIPKDRHHMLVRDPPPWDSVCGPDALTAQRIKLEKKTSLSGSSHLNPDRSSAQVKKSVQEMLDMITHRSLPATTSPSLPSTPTICKNPFRKDSTRGLTRGGLGDLHRRRSDSANSKCVPDGPAPKRMKSISQIPVPPRPTPPTMSRSTRAKNSNDSSSGIVSKKSGNLKQTTLLEVLGKRS